MARATDRAVVDLATYAPEQLGRTRYRTPDGFLLCEGVRIARTGPMLYAAAEMPDIEQGPFTAMITVMRDAEVLFAPDTILSYAGKPVTNDHPPCPVTPQNFKTYAVGTVLNPRRGEGAESEYLIADLLISDQQAIEDVEAGKIEVSAGYDTEVEQIKPGVARQTKNLGNHVALVARGRAGPACAIQDAAEEPAMAKRTTRILDGIRKAFRAKDEAALEEQLGKVEEAMDDEGDGDEPQRLVIEVKQPEAPAAAAAETEDEADPYEERFKKIEDALEGIGTSLAGLKPVEAAADADPDAEEVKDEEKEVEKSTAQDAMSKAEILAPGVRLPTFDAAATKVKVGAITALRRAALKAAVADSARKVHVDAVLAGRAMDFDKARPSEVAMVFDAASAVAKAANNASVHARPFDIPQGKMNAARMQARIVERRKANKA
ncbi:MAG: hypothetical protein JWQ97_3628 [Phenylobacterium sp.]|nr:hypothetical protein [Phenylobacterium sp.]